MLRRPTRSTLFPTRRSTSLVSVKATTVQVASFGPYSVKVIVPVGLVPRVRCATSFTDPPAATEPLAVVVSAGLALVTTTGSAEDTPDLQSRPQLVCRPL